MYCSVVLYLSRSEVKGHPLSPSSQETSSLDFLQFVGWAGPFPAPLFGCQPAQARSSGLPATGARLVCGRSCLGSNGASPQERLGAGKAYPYTPGTCRCHHTSTCPEIERQKKMFWGKSDSRPTTQQEPSQNNQTTDAMEENPTKSAGDVSGESKSSAELDRQTREILESKIVREVSHQRMNSKISGNEPLSCMKSFDKLLGCYSISNQIKSIYRYGNLDYDACNQSFRDFKFCLSLKYKYDNSDPNNDLQSLHWNRRKAEKILNGPNSQDVWEARQIEPMESALFKS